MLAAVISEENEYLEMPLIYSPLHEENTIKEYDWNKKTLKYIDQNNESIKSIIKNKIGYKKKFYLSNSEEEDIYQNFLLYMSGKRDFENNHMSLDDGKEVTIEKYVNISLHKYIIRHCYDRYLDKREFVYTEELPEYADVGHNSDKLYEDIRIKDALKNIEYKRYKYNVDMFLFIFVKKYAECHKIGYKVVESFLNKNISRNINIKGLERDAQVIELIRDLSTLSDKEQLKRLGEFVFGHKNIIRALEYASKVSPA